MESHAAAPAVRRWSHGAEAQEKGQGEDNPRIAGEGGDPGRGARKWRIFTATLDTGAVWSRIGARKAAKLGLGPILDVVRIKTSGGGRQNRVLVPASLRIGSCRIAALFSVSMRRPGVLIGTRTMSSRFVVDPKQRYLAGLPSLK